MGDRANIIVIDQDEPLAGVVLYSHWSGSDIKETVTDALVRGRERWSDPQYLTRIIFDTLTHGDRGETGFGISSFIGDNEHDYLVVDVPRQVVVKVKHDTASPSAQGVMIASRRSKGKSFADYAAKGTPSAR